MSGIQVIMRGMEPCANLGALVRQRRLRSLMIFLMAVDKNDSNIPVSIHPGPVLSNHLCRHPGVTAGAGASYLCRSGCIR